MTPNDNIHSLAGPYAMDALDDLERVRFEAHLDSCESCLLETAEFMDTAALLGQVEEVPVPAAFRELVLSDIDNIRQVGPIRTPVRRFAPRLLSLAAGVLAVAVIGLSVVTAGLRSENQELTPLAAVAEILTQDDAITLDHTLEEGTLHVVASPGSGTGAVIATGLDHAPTGHDYQLWLLDAEGHALSAGLLTVAADGTGIQLMEGDMTGVTGIGVTIEPAGGSEAPTTTPIAVITLSA